MEDSSVGWRVLMSHPLFAEQTYHILFGAHKLSGTEESEDSSSNQSLILFYVCATHVAGVTWNAKALPVKQ